MQQHAQPLQLVEQQTETSLVVALLDIALLWQYFGDDYQRVIILSSSRQLHYASTRIRNETRMLHFSFIEIDRLQEARDHREAAELEYTILQEVDHPFHDKTDVMSMESWMFSSS